MTKLKVSWKQLQLYSRDKNNYNMIRKKIFSLPCLHTSKRLKWWRLACGFKAADGTNHELLPACGNQPIGLGGCKKPLQGEGPSMKSKTHSHSTDILPAPPCWAYHKCASWEYVAWPQPKLATIHIVLHWAEIPVRISQRLGEICSYWQMCCDAVLTSSHKKTRSESTEQLLNQQCRWQWSVLGKILEFSSSFRFKK